MDVSRPSRSIAWLGLAGMMLLAVFELTGLDLVIVRAFWDPVLGIFPLRGDPLLSALLYRGTKSAMYALGVVALVILAVAYRRTRDADKRGAYVVAGLTLLLMPLLVVLLKHMTNRYCPWALEGFGGEVPYTTLLQALPPPWVRGECFPAGHAAGGFVWVGVAVALWRQQPWIARGLLAFGTVAGGAMGLFRMAEGAHFLSHTLWTLWLACFVPLAISGLQKLLRHKSRSG